MPNVVEVSHFLVCEEVDPEALKQCLLSGSEGYRYAQVTDRYLEYDNRFELYNLQTGASSGLHAVSRLNGTASMLSVIAV